MSEDIKEFPERLKCFVRDIGNVCKKHNIGELHGRFSDYCGNDNYWTADISFYWCQGRHSEESSKIELNSSYTTLIKLEQELEDNDNGEGK